MSYVVVNKVGFVNSEVQNNNFVIESRPEGGAQIRQGTINAVGPTVFTISHLQPTPYVDGSDAPTASVMYSTSDTPTSGWVACLGQELSQITYKRLFDVIGLMYNPTPTAGTFKVPSIPQKTIGPLYPMMKT